MVPLKTFALLLILLPMITGCSKLSYLYFQGKGQLSMLWNARENQEILDDPSIDNGIKSKIRKIETLKNYFSKYWDHDIGEIYDRTYFVGADAITYLVISSPKNEVRPV